MTEPSLVLKLWQSGAFLAAGTLAIYLALSLVAKIDSKRAFYYSAGVAGLAAVVDTIVAGHQLTWSALVTALVGIASIIAKGPDLKKPSADTEKPVEL